MRKTFGFSWGLSFSLILLATVGILTASGGLAVPEAALEDIRSNAFAPERTPHKVVVVLIDEEDMKVSPWDRPIAFWGTGLSDLFNKLHRKGAKVVALDVVLSGEVDRAIKAVIEDAAEEADIGQYVGLLLPRGLMSEGGPLLKELKQAAARDKVLEGPNSLIPGWLANDPPSLNPNQNFADALTPLVTETRQPVIGTSATFPVDRCIGNVVGLQLGAVEVPPSRDGKIRELYFRTEANESGLAYQTALAAGLAPTNHKPGETYRFAQVRDIPRIPLADALADEGKYDSALNDAIVFIGLNRLDMRSSALDAEIPGVEIQANGTAALLDGRIVKEWPWTVWLAFLGAALLAVFLHRRSVWLSLSIFLGVAVIWAVSSFALYGRSLVLVPMAAPFSMFLATWVGVAVGHGAEADRLRKLMGPIVSPKVLQYLLKTPEVELRNGRWFEITALFLDMRDSTRLCATMPTATFSALINDLFQCTIECVGRHGGYVSRLTGDGFFAIFGFPDEDQSADREAFLAAREMIRAVEQFNRDHRDREVPWRVGIGIHSGPILIAAVGPPDRWELTAVGETVNLASRMESLSKVLDTSIVISEKVRNGLPVDDRVGFVEHPMVEIKGSGPLTVFSIADDSGSKALPQ